MRIQAAFWFGLLSTFSLLPVRAQEAGPTVLAKGLFSYQAPPGWRVITSSHSKFPVSIGAASDGQKPVIYVAVSRATGTLSDYTTAVFKILRAKPNTTIVNQQPFSTSAGLEGVRILVRQAQPKINIQSIFYLFDGGGDNKLMIVGGCALAEATRNTPLFDASVKTFSLE